MSKIFKTFQFKANLIPWLWVGPQKGQTRLDNWNQVLYWFHRKCLVLLGPNVHIGSLFYNSFSSMFWKKEKDCFPIKNSFDQKEIFSLAKVFRERQRGKKLLWCWSDLICCKNKQKIKEMFVCLRKKKVLNAHLSEKEAEGKALVSTT